jgi:hypothetical protein
LIFRGNPKNCCDFAFTTIDKNKNGKIDFPEFMAAVAVTHPGNLDMRLHLVRNKIFISTNVSILFALRYFRFMIMIILER